MFAKGNFVQSPPVATPPHANYEKNVQFAKKFARDRETLLPTGMKLRFDKTMHEKPRIMLLVTYRRHRNFCIPSFANYVRLDDDHFAEIQKNVIATYEKYLELADKYNAKCDLLGIKDPYDYALSA